MACAAVAIACGALAHLAHPQDGIGGHSHGQQDHGQQQAVGSKEVQVLEVLEDSCHGLAAAAGCKEGGGDAVLQVQLGPAGQGAAAGAPAGRQSDLRPAADASRVRNTGHHHQQHQQECQAAPGALQLHKQGAALQSDAALTSTPHHNHHNQPDPPSDAAGSPPKRHHRLLGVAVALGGGVVCCLVYPAINISSNDPFKWLPQGTPALTVYATNFWFSMAFSLSAFCLNLLMLYRPPPGTPRSSVSAWLADHDCRGWSIFSAALTSLGDLAHFAGGEQAGYAASMMVAAYPFVGTLLGLVLYKEFRGSSVRARVALGGQFVFYMAAISLLAASSRKREER